MVDAPSGVPGNVGLTDPGSKGPAAWAGFRAVRVVSVTAETSTVRSLELAALDGEPLPIAEAGQFVAVRADIGDGELPATRSYSLSGPPGAAAYRISVKLAEQGRFSGFVHHRLAVGDELEIAAPRGRFTMDSGDAPVLLCSAGVGATPVLAMLHAQVRRGAAREVWWLHGARNGADHVFAGEARALLARLPNARARIFYSAPLPTDRLGSDYTRSGRLTADALAELPIPTDAQAYICGPPTYLADLRTALVGMGLDDGRVHSEVFGAGPSLTPGITATAVVPPHPPAGDPGNGPSISFSRSGLSVCWRTDFDSVLELAEACDVPARWSCRSGVCHNCETGLLAGAVTYDPEPVDPPADGNVLICCASPGTDLVLDL